MGIFVFSRQKAGCLYFLSVKINDYRSKTQRLHSADHFKSASKNMRLQSTLLQSKCTAVVLTYAHLWGILDTDKGIVKS